MNMKWVDRKKKTAAFAISALSVVLLSGCAALFDGMYLARDVKKTSDEYRQEKHEERVDELNTEYQEFLESQGRAESDDKESEQSVVIVKDDIEPDRSDAYAYRSSDTTAAISVAYGRRSIRQ